MSCTSPRTVSQSAPGARINYSSAKYNATHKVFQVPCGKCLGCRLDYAKQWAIRCVHEAQLHEKNCFITLTYSDENLKSPKLVYSDWQKFMKKVRKTQEAPIGVFVTGEYGDRTRRPHWHALLFGWRPSDATPKRTNERGDSVYSSALLDTLWNKGLTEFGEVTIHSAGYCARYAAKKLVHGKDGHDWEPISKKSSKHAIGKKWLETYYKDIFNYGRLTLADGTSSTIPRYYERWFKETHPEEHARYVTQIKEKKMINAALRAEEEKKKWLENFHERRDLGRERPLTQLEIKKIIQERKTKELLEKLKL